jgi:hypothetical protein
MRTIAAVAAALALVSAAPLQGQQREINRALFTFGKTTLTVDVSVDTEGTLRVIRGQRGEIRVAARAVDGFADFGLKDRRGNVLQLTAVGTDRVDFIVVVPENVRLRVRLPDRPVSETFGMNQPVGTFSWAATPLPAPGHAFGEPGPETPVLAAAAPAPGLNIAHSASTAPRTLAISDETELRRLTVLLEGTRFEVATDRALRLRGGHASTLEIRAPGAPLDLVVRLPADTREFLLQVGSAPALLIRDGAVSALCSPVIDQLLDAHRRSFTFTPTDGRLRCAPRTLPGVIQS